MNGMQKKSMWRKRNGLRTSAQLLISSFWKASHNDEKFSTVKTNCMLDFCSDTFSVTFMLLYSSFKSGVAVFFGIAVYFFVSLYCARCSVSHTLSYCWTVMWMCCLEYTVHWCHNFSSFFPSRTLSLQLIRDDSDTVLGGIRACWSRLVRIGRH